MKFQQSSILFFLGLIVLAGFSACSDPELSDSVNQDKIFTNYELFYNQNTDITRATASFHFGNSVTGTPLELSGGSDVSINGEGMSMETEPITNLTYYKAEFAGNVGTGTFVWTDADGQAYTNTIALPEIDYPAGMDSINRTAAYDLIWQGTALGTDETVGVSINGTGEGDASGWIQNSSGATSIILDAAKLGQVALGPATLWMDRSYEPQPAEVTSNGGHIKARIRPENATVEIVE